MPPKSKPRIARELTLITDPRSSAKIRGKIFVWLLRFCFFFHRDLDLAGHVPMQAHRNFKFAQALDGLIELKLAAIDIETLPFQRVRNVRRCDRPEQVVFLADCAES